MNERVRSSALDTAQVFTIYFLMSTVLPPPPAPVLDTSYDTFGNTSLKKGRCSPQGRKGQLPGYLASVCPETPLCTEQGHSNQTLLAGGSFKLEGSPSQSSGSSPPCVSQS